MSDVNDSVAKLEAIRKVLMKQSIFFCAGWFLFVISWIGLNYAMDHTSSTPAVIGLIGWGIIGFPKIWRLVLSGWGAAFKADYEVVTTYGDGSKTSDGGWESMQTNMIVKGIQILVLLIIGAFITMLHMIFLTFKYLFLYRKTTPKPAFIQSGLFIMVINVAVFIGSFVVGAVIQKIAML